jgi:hypothetical protein
VTDAYSGVRVGATTISFGDGSRAVRRRVDAVHSYARRGLYGVTVRCASNAGNAAVDHLLVRVR